MAASPPAAQAEAEVDAVEAVEAEEWALAGFEPGQQTDEEDEEGDDEEAALGGETLGAACTPSLEEWLREADDDSDEDSDED